MNKSLKLSVFDYIFDIIWLLLQKKCAAKLFQLFSLIMKLLCQFSKYFIDVSVPFQICQRFYMNEICTFIAIYLQRMLPLLFSLSILLLLLLLLFSLSTLLLLLLLLIGNVKTLFVMKVFIIQRIYSFSFIQILLENNQRGSARKKGENLIVIES